MPGFEDIGSKGHFSAKRGGFGGQKPPWGAIENFFQKSAWNIFLDSSRCSFVQKSLKSDARISRYGVMDGRTSVIP